MSMLPCTPLLVSACLLGQPVRYDGRAQAIHSSVLLRWQEQGRVFSYCPEVAGGLPVPRPAAELQANGQILTRSGEDVTDAFRRGAAQALTLCLQHGIRLALLKARSPSCGNHQIYDGRFRGQLIAGEGVTAALLRRHGISVYSEFELSELEAQLARFDAALG